MLKNRQTNCCLGMQRKVCAKPEYDYCKISSLATSQGGGDTQGTSGSWQCSKSWLGKKTKLASLCPTRQLPFPGGDLPTWPRLSAGEAGKYRPTLCAIAASPGPRRVPVRSSEWLVAVWLWASQLTSEDIGLLSCFNLTLHGGLYKATLRLHMQRVLLGRHFFNPGK